MLIFLLIGKRASHIHVQMLVEKNELWNEHYPYLLLLLHFFFL